jgi:two-component system chemotaxis sensor kinase CheA
LPDGDDAQIAQCIFLPGFSTSSALTTVSGRGVGLDAVRASVEQMRGIVDVGSVAGEGTHFTLTLPLTLTTIRALLVRAGGEAFAIDSASVIELRRVALDTIRSVGGRDMLSVHGRLVPIAPLAALLSLEILPPSALTSKVPVVVLGGTGQDAALIVDELLDEQEVVVRTLGSRLKHVRHIAGATILGNGRVALILNNRDLLETALGRGISGSLTVAPAGTAVPTRKRLLLVDDSLTTRTLERSILESAGYEVVAVADGVEAWAILQESGADLVLSDVDMPRMDGFALTETIRSSKRFRTLPVVLVTARESDEEKARGLAAGADAYLMKSGFDQQVLLEAVGQLL